MKVRLTIAARATAGAMLMAVAVAACTSGPPSSAAPSIFTPQPATPTSATPATGPTRTPTVGHGTAPATSSARASGRATSTTRATSTARATATTRATPTPKATAKASPTARATPTHRATAAPTTARTQAPYPTAAPETGGGGTAGLQDGLLFGIGGAAILAGLGSLGYRRRLRRRHRADTAAPPVSTPTRTGIR